MKTKEEILQKYKPLFIYEKSYSEEDVLSAMEEYAKQSRQADVSCWACRFCDKESVLKGDKWVLTRTGYCLAEKSAVNGENDFYKKVYVNTVYNECSQFEPCS